MRDASDSKRVVRFGVFEMDLAARELRKGGVRVRLQDQPFRVLTLLVERPCEIVTREEIKDAIWADDTFVEFDHGLNTAVQKIRQSLGDSATSPRFLETVPRRGYRFVAPVEPRRPAPETNPDPPPPRPRNWKRAFGAAAVVVIAAAVRIFWPGPPPERTPLAPRPLTTYQGSESQPAFSPSGDQIAFVWDGENGDNFDVYVKGLGPGDPVRLTDDPLTDEAPSWSPDGQSIAFIRRHADNRDEILVKPALGGTERRVAEVSLFPGSFGLSLDWSPDGQWLATQHRKERMGTGLVVLISAADGAMTTITSPDIEGRATDRYARFSPDGRRLAFVRSSNLFVTPLSEQSLPSGPPQQLTEGEEIRIVLGGIDWEPDGATILLSSGEAGRRGIWRVNADGRGSPERIDLPEAYARWPVVADSRLAYVRESRDANIWRAEIDPRTGKPGKPHQLIASSFQEGHVAYGPDGRIAFHSDRTGGFEIWLADGDGSNLLQLTSFGGPHASRPVWSPDGSQIAFNAYPDGQSEIYVISSEGGKPRRLTEHPGRDSVPHWSRDGLSIYFTSSRSGESRLWKVPVAGGEPEQVTSISAVGGFEGPDGTLYLMRGSQGLWKMPPDGTEPTQVSARVRHSYVAADAIGATYVDSGELRRYRFDTDQDELLMEVGERAAPAGAISPDGRWVVFTQVDRRGSDLMLVEDFR